MINRYWMYGERYHIELADNIGFKYDPILGITPEHLYRVYDREAQIYITGPREMRDIEGRCERLNYEESVYLDNIVEYCT